MLVAHTVSTYTPVTRATTHHHMQSHASHHLLLFFSFLFFSFSFSSLSSFLFFSSFSSSLSLLRPPSLSPSLPLALSLSLSLSPMNSVGAVYTGGFKNGLWHGDGVLVLPTGARFAGVYDAGLREGTGRFEWVRQLRHSFGTLLANLTARFCPHTLQR